jgi:hypothetical protein
MEAQTRAEFRLVINQPSAEPFLMQFMIEMFTPGEIIEDCLPCHAKTAFGALAAAELWIKDERHRASHVRVLAADGRIAIENLLTELV